MQLVPEGLLLSVRLILAPCMVDCGEYIICLQEGYPMQRPHHLACVLFDFDGVCADTERYGLELDREVYEQFGIEPTEEEMRTLVGTTGIESIPALFARHGMKVTAEEFFAHRRENITIYRDMPLEAEPGLKDLLDRLRRQGVRTGLVSTTDALPIIYALDRLAIMGRFDIVVTGDMVERHKPLPDPYLEALARLGVEASCAIAIEDSPTGIRSAKDAGLYVLGYQGGSIPQDVSGADEAIQSFCGLAL